MKLKIKNISFSYNSRPTLDDICLEVGSSELLVIVGPNGSGKSTLLRCMDRILKPQRGTVLLCGQDIKGMKKSRIAKLVGYVPQVSPRVFPTTVFDAVLIGRRPHLGWRNNEKDIDKVMEVLKLLKIEGFAMRDFGRISGGEQQKILLARALVQETEILLLDEPTSNLDIRHQLEAIEVVKGLVREKSLSVVMSIHDLNLASRYADRMVMLNRGRICGAGTPASVLTPELIEHAYGVRTIVKSESGKPYIIPVGVSG